MKKKLSILALVLAFAVAFAGTANAELFFITLDNSYSNTSLGVVKNDFTPIPNLVENMGGNSGHGIYPFVNMNGQFRMAVSLYTYGAGVPDTINIYAPGDPSGWDNPAQWRAPLKEVVTDLQNIRKLIDCDGYLYGIAYDVPVIVRINTLNDSYVQDKRFEYEAQLEEKIGGEDVVFDVHAEGIFEYNGYIFVIFTASHDPWGDALYKKNVLCKFDKALNLIETFEMAGKNLDGFTRGSYTVAGSRLIATSLGGKQPYDFTLNEESCIEVINLDRLYSEQVITAKQVNEADGDFTHMFCAAAAAPDGKVYIQAKRADSMMMTFEIRIYETTMDKLLAGDIGELLYETEEWSAFGYLAGLEYDPLAKRLWCAEGWNFKGYDGNEWVDIGAREVKGNHSSFAVVYPKGNLVPYVPGYDSGGGGCNTGFGALLLLSLLPLAAVRRIKK